MKIRWDNTCRCLDTCLEYSAQAGNVSHQQDSVLVGSAFYIKNFYLLDEGVHTFWLLILSLVLFFKICVFPVPWILAYLTHHCSWTWHVWAASSLLLSSEHSLLVVPLCPSPDPTLPSPHHRGSVTFLLWDFTGEEAASLISCASASQFPFLKRTNLSAWSPYIWAGNSTLSARWLPSVVFLKYHLIWEHWITFLCLPCRWLWTEMCPKGCEQKWCEPLPDLAYTPSSCLSKFSPLSTAQQRWAQLPWQTGLEMTEAQHGRILSSQTFVKDW